MKKLFIMIALLVIALVLVSCGGSDTDYDMSTADGIKAYTDAYFEKDSTVTIDSLSVNENAEKPGEFILVINWTFNNENDAEQSKKTTQATSDLFVTDIQDKAPELTDITSNIKVPHLNGTGKIHYERSDKGFNIENITYSF